MSRSLRSLSNNNTIAYQIKLNALNGVLFYLVWCIKNEVHTKNGEKQTNKIMVTFSHVATPLDVIDKKKRANFVDQTSCHY